MPDTNNWKRQLQDPKLKPLITEVERLSESRVTEATFSEPTELELNLASGHSLRLAYSDDRWQVAAASDLPMTTILKLVAFVQQSKAP